MEQDEIDLDERKDRAQELLDGFWALVMSHYDTEDLSEEELLDVFASIGMIMGSGMDMAYSYNPTLPYQLFGVASDFCHQLLYSSRYGLDMNELENQRQNLQ
jgi:hypothetical protein